MKGIEALAHVIADPGEGAATLIIGFFKLLGVVGRLLTSKSPAANVAGIFLGFALLAGLCWWLLQPGSARRGKKGGRRGRRDRAARRKKDEAKALAVSRSEPPGRASSTPEPEARAPGRAERPVRISPDALSAKDDTQSEEDAESARAGGERADEKGSSRR